MMDLFHVLDSDGHGESLPTFWVGFGTQPWQKVHEVTLLGREKSNLMLD